MGEEEPEAEDGLGEDIENGVGNDLSININLAGAVGNTPDAVKSQSSTPTKRMQMDRDGAGPAIMYTCMNALTLGRWSTR